MSLTDTDPGNALSKSLQNSLRNYFQWRSFSTLQVDIQETSAYCKYATSNFKDHALLIFK